MTSILLTPGDLSPKTVPSPSFSPSWWGIDCFTFGYNGPDPSVVSPGTFVGSCDWTRVVLVPSLVRRVNNPIVIILRWSISWWELIERKTSSYQIACGSKLFAAVISADNWEGSSQRHHHLGTSSTPSFSPLPLPCEHPVHACDEGVQARRRGDVTFSRIHYQITFLPFVFRPNSGTRIIMTPRWNCVQYGWSWFSV